MENCNIYLHYMLYGSYLFHNCFKYSNFIRVLIIVTKMSKHYFISNELKVMLDQFEYFENMSEALSNQILHHYVNMYCQQNFNTKSEIYTHINCNEDIHFLISNGATIDAVSKDGKTPLQVAAFTKNVKIISVLIEHGANVNLETKYGIPFHIAACTRNQEIIKLFLQNGIDINVKNNNNDTALHLMCQYTMSDPQHVHACNYLLQFGADINAENCNKKTPLFCAIEVRNIVMVKTLLQYKLDINVEGNKLALMESLKDSECHEDISELLIEHGFTFNKEDATNIEILVNAIENSHIKALEELLKLGADTETLVEVSNEDISQKLTLLQAAIVSNSFFGVVKVLLNHGANVHIKDENDKNILFLSVLHSNIEIAEELLLHEVDINAELEDSTTVLHYAAGQGNTEMVKLFIKYKAHINHKTKIGDTPFHRAVVSENCDVVLVLKNHGADINAKMHKNLTPIHLTIIYNKLDILRKLLRCGVDINSQDYFGRTPLHIAASRGFYECIKYLLVCDADVNIKDVFGKTPYNIATEYMENSRQKNGVEIYESINREFHKFLMSFDKIVDKGDRDFNDDFVEVDIDYNFFYEYKDNNDSNCNIVNIIERYSRFVENMKRILNMNKEDVEKLIMSKDTNKRDSVLAQEVMLMRNEEYCEGITLYDMLTRNCNEVVEYLIYNTCIIKHMHILQKLDSYQWLIIKKIDAVYERFMLRLTELILNELFEHKLPIVVIQIIVSYLSIEDMNNFLKTIQFNE